MSWSQISYTLCWILLGECDGDGVVFVCLWFRCSGVPRAVSVWVYAPVMLHIWLSTLINHVLCIF